MNCLRSNKPAPDADCRCATCAATRAVAARLKPKTWSDVPHFKHEDMSVAYLWTTFAGHVLPTAPEMQRTEMKKAFYAGFFECFKVMNDYATSLPEAAAAQLFERLSAESHEFFAKMMREYGR